MAFNPTTNRAPLGLLEQHERIALTTWPHGLERYDFNRKIWMEATYQGLHPVHCVFRGKPAPREDM